MLKRTDRVFAVILGLGSFGHSYGSLTSYGHQPITLLWSLTASVLVLLLGVLHLLRSLRSDRVLAWILIAPTLFWLGSAVEFGILIGHPFDPRVLLFVVLSAGLIAFSLRTALDRASPRSGEFA
jgi:hypothetical protein